MRGSRTRFTIRRMMVAVAIVALVLAIELQLIPFSIRQVSEHGNVDDYIPSEARLVWVLMHIPIVLTVLLIRSFRKVHRRRDASFAPTLPVAPDPRRPE